MYLNSNLHVLFIIYMYYLHLNTEDVYEHKFLKIFKKIIN